MPGTADDDSSDDDIFSENAPLRSLPPAKASGAGPRRAEPSRATQRKASKRKRPERSTTPDSSPEPAAAAAAGRTALPHGSRRYRPSVAAPLAGAPAAAAAAAAAPRPASPDWSCYKCGCTQAAVCDTHSSVVDAQLLPSAALAQDKGDIGPSEQKLAKDKRRFVANRMKRCGHCRQRKAEFVRRDSKTPANAAGGALRLALRSASAPPTLRPAPPNSHGSLFYETSIDKKILRALARYAVVEKHPLPKVGRGFASMDVPLEPEPAGHDGAPAEAQAAHRHFGEPRHVTSPQQTPPGVRGGHIVLGFLVRTGLWGEHAAVAEVHLELLELVGCPIDRGCRAAARQQLHHLPDARQELLALVIELGAGGPGRVPEGMQLDERRPHRDDGPALCPVEFVSGIRVRRN